ncbi:MAG: HD domain-containing protein [Cyanobacteria bacterium CRU_2_1]|nr:HD domain-containing protein [Cyanobacteria bacterium RU_5_0]NJR57398.1 HD domain-containing protein [Cyanobacteria bacterium CRU_2_1]
MRQHVLDWLAENVPESRVKHVLRVEETAISLAYEYAIDLADAAQAGLMHDLAKYFRPQILLDMAQKAGLAIDPVDEANPHLLHADVSAIVAREKFGVDDPKILEAIANHTLGRPGMSPLSCIVFLADTLEPGRGDTPELNLLRQVSRQDLFKAVWMTCDYTLKYLLETRRLIHPRALSTRNWFLEQANRSLLHSASEAPKVFISHPSA